MKRLAICFFVFWSLGFRGWHFTDDPETSDFDNDWDGAAFTWSQSGSLETATGNTADGRLIRKTDASVDSDVQIRAMSVGSNIPFGPVCNWINGNNFYMVYARSSGTVRIYKKISGSYTVLATKAYTFSNSTYYNLRITSADNGANKDLECFVDGVSELTASTSSKLGSGRAGFDANPAGSTINIEWFTFDLSMTATSVDPTYGRHSGGEAATIVGTSFGDEMQLEFDGTTATSIASEPTTIITGVTPANGQEPCDVVVGFGTAGSPEHAVTITDGFTYWLRGGHGTLGGGQ